MTDISELFFLLNKQLLVSEKEERAKQERKEDI